MEEKIKVKTNGKRNRDAGHNFERKVVKILRDAGFKHVVSSRSESRSRDNEKVDLINKDEAVNGRLPYNISCKNYSKYLKYHTLLQEMPEATGAVNVLFHKFTIRSGVNFQPAGHYAILNMEDFVSLIQRVHELEKKKANDISY